MGEAEDRQAEADHLSGGQEADRSSSESTVGEGEASRLMPHPRDESRCSELGLRPTSE